MTKVNVRYLTRIKVDSVLHAKGVNTTVFWDTAYVSCSGNTRLQVRCNTCENVEDFGLSPISIGRYVCHFCRDNAYKSACEKLNLNLIEKVYENKRHLLVTTCKNCGEERRTNSGHILRGLFRCSGCLLLKYRNLCSKLNLTFLDKIYSENRTKVSTVCNICGNQDTIASSDLINGKFRCEGCKINKYESELKKKNCSLISFEKRKGNKSLIHYTNSAGDCFSTASGNIVRGEFETNINGRWWHHNFTYLIKLQVEDSYSICKIGTSNDPEKRAKKLKLNRPYSVFILGSFENRKLADKLESELHKEFSDYRLCKSEAAVYTDGVRSQKDTNGNRHKVKDGITEWFSSEVYETLKIRYNLT